MHSLGPVASACFQLSGPLSYPARGCKNSFTVLNLTRFSTSTDQGLSMMHAVGYCIPSTNNDIQNFSFGEPNPWSNPRGIPLKILQVKLSMQWKRSCWVLPKEKPLRTFCPNQGVCHGAQFQLLLAGPRGQAMLASQIRLHYQCEVVCSISFNPSSTTKHPASSLPCDLTTASLQVLWPEHVTHSPLSAEPPLVLHAMGDGKNGHSIKS